MSFFVDGIFGYSMRSVARRSIYIDELHVANRWAKI